MVKEAGFDSLIAYQIILCESGGNSQAHNWNDPNGGSHGLWQLNGAHKLSMEEMLDVRLSTEYAIKLMMSSRSLSHWSCYR